LFRSGGEENAPQSTEPNSEKTVNVAPQAKTVAEKQPQPSEKTNVQTSKQAEHKPDGVKQPVVNPTAPKPKQEETATGG
ncbi:MAG: hypothetical protein Q9M10_01080, partial [Mariprofundaceae bacterium]|nr:hypothetical protein [Mariprofundaceae bacterium]